VRLIPNLTIDNLNSGYGDLQVLWNVSLEVKEGQIVSLIGSNGAGKTTTLKTIAGILRPKSGKITFGNDLLNKSSMEKIVESGIVYVPEGRQIFQEMSVQENLQMGAYSRRARRNQSENLKSVYSLFPILQEKEKSSAGTLSGGQAQMLAIARGMMASPKLLMLDEPSAGLSPKMSDRIFEAVKKLREDGITILLVEQDAGRSLKLSDSAFVLENGTISAAGRGEDLLNNEHVRQSYLGM
jgi:branched-chain amino acid transport system ATP-binding protein